MPTQRESGGKPEPVKPYFSPAALKFLRGLKRNNRREWFEARRETYEREIKAPMLALIDGINQSLEKFSPEHVRPPRKCMMRIYRDIRFSADKRPYKYHAGAWWSAQGLERTSGAGFYLHVAGNETVIAAGVYMPDRDQLLAIRKYLLDHHDQVRRLLYARGLRRQMDLFPGERLTRPPKGFPKDHPAMDLLTMRQWGVEVTLPAETALQPDFPRQVVSLFRLAAPLVHALNTPLLAGIQGEKHLLFGFPKPVRKGENRNI